MAALKPTRNGSSAALTTRNFGSLGIDYLYAILAALKIFKLYAIWQLWN